MGHGLNQYNIINNWGKSKILFSLELTLCGFESFKVYNQEVGFESFKVYKQEVEIIKQKH